MLVRMLRLRVPDLDLTNRFLPHIKPYPSSQQDSRATS
jgi:hypothetical protein